MHPLSIPGSVPISEIFMATTKGLAAAVEPAELANKS
jgi:hypothetical protein